MIGINIASGQMSSIVPTFTLIDLAFDFFQTKYRQEFVPIKYFWRDVNQVSYQYSKWGNNTSAILAVQNQELPLSFGDSLKILEPFKILSSNGILDAFTVGNEADVLYTPQEFSDWVLDSMEQLHLATQRVQMTISISTPLTMKMFGWESLQIDPLWQPIFERLMEFLDRTESPFMINLYPYLSWYQHQDIHTFEEAMTLLLTEKLQWIRECMDRFNYTQIPIWVTETGWPTDGNDATTIENSKRYFDHVKNVSQQLNIPIYWFELIDENLKPGGEDEHHYGLYGDQGQLKFLI